MPQWSKERVAGYKRPRSYAFVAEDELPRNGLGKLLYRELKAKFLPTAAERRRSMTISPDSVAGLIARLLQRRGVRRVFALCGGHIMPIWMRLDAEGIRIIDVRDERAAVHMAQAHAELTGELGVALVTAGPGLTNAMHRHRQRRMCRARRC